MHDNDMIVTKDLDLVSKIHGDPKYVSWRYEYKDGEYRFYSPTYKKEQEEKNIEIIENNNNMAETDRITNTINRVAPSPSPIGRNDPTALSTKDGFVYRETGVSQIQDIIDCGYVRSNTKRKSNQVWWTYGGENSFHINKRPVLVASADVVEDFKIGAISIDALTEIWMYDENTQQWNNKLNDIKKLYLETQQEKLNNNLNLEIEEIEKPKAR